MLMSELRCFLIVAEEQHIGRAAQRVYLSQPALSRLVHRIEQTVGTPLLDRSAGRVSLTPAGAAFAAAVANIVGDFDRAVLHARAVAMEQEGERRRRRLLRVGMLFPAAAQLTGPILAAHRMSAPNVDLQIIDVSGLGGEQALTSGRVDVAFLWSPVVAHGISTITLFRDRFALLVASNHRLANSPKVTVEDVSKGAVHCHDVHEPRMAAGLHP